MVLVTNDTRFFHKSLIKMSLLSEVWNAEFYLNELQLNQAPASVYDGNMLTGNGNQEVVHIPQDMRGLMMDVLSNIPVKKVLVVEVDETSAAQCSICHEIVQIGDEVRRLPCDHAFHQKCIDVWVLQHATCPNCRRNVLDDNLPNKSDDTSAHDTRSLRF